MTDFKVRCSEEELAAWKRAAEAEQQKFSAWVREQLSKGMRSAFPIEVVPILEPVPERSSQRPSVASKVVEEAAVEEVIIPEKPPRKPGNGLCDGCSRRQVARCDACIAMVKRNTPSALDTFSKLLQSEA